MSCKLSFQTHENLLQKSCARLSAHMSCKACFQNTGKLLAQEWRKTVCTDVLHSLLLKEGKNLLQKSCARLSAHMSCKACFQNTGKLIAKEWRKTVCTYVLHSLLLKEGKSYCKRVAQDCLHICLAQLVAKTRKAEHIFN